MTSNDEIDDDEDLVEDLGQGLLESIIPGRSLYLKIRNLLVIAFIFVFMASWPVWILLSLTEFVFMRMPGFLYNIFDKLVWVIFFIMIVLQFRQMKRMSRYALFVIYVGMLLVIWLSLIHI